LTTADGTLPPLYPWRDKGGSGYGVVVIGVGGLGSAAASELAASGVARLGLVDADRVELSNLHRQLLHGPQDIGRFKAVVAAERLRALHPEVSIEARVQRFSPQIADEILEGFDLAIDATDNAEAKFALNDGCIEHGRPLVHAGVVGFEGQLLTILPRETACLRCLFPEAPDDDEVASCSRAGILGPFAALIGAMQAREALALFGGGEVRSAGRLLTIDSRTLGMREIPLRRTATCPACGALATARRVGAVVENDVRFKETP
jgi:molybdopterin-synthase adenylyltransferase